MINKAVEILGWVVLAILLSGAFGLIDVIINIS
jgi:hypothetical protein